MVSEQYKEYSTMVKEDESHLQEWTLFDIIYIAKNEISKAIKEAMNHHEIDYHHKKTDSKIWHSPDEEPENGKQVLLHINLHINNPKVKNLCVITYQVDDFREYKNNAVEWAYIEDLLNCRN